MHMDYMHTERVCETNGLSYSSVLLTCITVVGRLCVSVCLLSRQQKHIRQKNTLKNQHIIKGVSM